MMKRFFTILLALLCALPACAGSYRVEEVPNVQRSDSRRYVSNPDGILSDAAVARIDTLCANLRREGVAEVAVVAVDAIEGGDPFSFAIDLFRSWGVGREGADNGLGILLVKDLREIRFVTGGGLEGVMTDAMAKRIQMQYMLPHFRSGDYDSGMVAGVAASAELLRGGGLHFADNESEDWRTILPAMGFLALLFLLVVAVVYVREKRCPECGRLGVRQVGSDVVSLTRNYRIIEITNRCTRCGHTFRRRVRSPRNHHIGGGGGPFIGGMGGGSFGGGSFGGGFGGGSFGGGGAGSRW